MFETTTFDRNPRDLDAYIEQDDALWRVEREQVRLARALLVCSDPNDLWREARARMRGRRYVQLDDLVQDLRRETVPVELRAMGARPVNDLILRANIGDFLREVLWDAARYRAREPLPSPADGEPALGSRTSDIAFAIHGGVSRGLALVGAGGRGHIRTSYILTGRIMELAGFTQRRVRPSDDIDLARIEAVRRSLRRALVPFSTPVQDLDAVPRSRV